MPQITGTGISLATAFGQTGDVAMKGFGDFASHSHFRLFSATDLSTNEGAPSYLSAYRQRREKAHQNFIMGSVVVLLVVVVVLAWLLVRKSSGRKGHPAAPAAPGSGGAVPNGPAPAPQVAGQVYDMKDMEIDRKDKELERKEAEIERKERELEKERERRQNLASKHEAERAGFERELEGRKDELRKMREERDQLQHQIETMQSKHDAEMRLMREEYDAKAADVRKRFEEQLSEFESSQKNFWPEVFQEARSLSRFCECVKDSFADGSKTAAALYAELVNLGSRMGDMQAFVNQIAPLGKALYAWIYDSGKTEDRFDALLAEWLTGKISGVDLKVVAVKPGEAYNSSIHDCAKVGGNSVSKVLSFLILGKSNRTELKAIVEVG